MVFFRVTRTSRDSALVEFLLFPRFAHPSGNPGRVADTHVLAQNAAASDDCPGLNMREIPGFRPFADLNMIVHRRETLNKNRKSSDFRGILFISTLPPFFDARPIYSNSNLQAACRSFVLRFLRFSLKSTPHNERQNPRNPAVNTIIFFFGAIGPKELVGFLTSRV